MANSIKVKEIDFLKHDVNQNEYQMVKSGKSLLNLPKHQIYNQHHSSIHDFTLNPKNSIAEYPFTGNSSWYAEFDLPSLNYHYHQFVLRFKLYCNADLQILPAPMMIDRVVLLKNSNVLSEVNSEDIMLYNLHKISNKYGTIHDDFDYDCQMLLKKYNNAFLEGLKLYTLYSQYPTRLNMELPICLTNSNFLSSAIKNQLTLRIYFRGDIIVSNTGSNNNIKIDELKLMLRMKECNHIYKEPKYNHQFTKKILTKINIPKLDGGSNYTVNITGFNSVASFALVFIRDLDNQIKTNESGPYHLYKYSIDEVSMSDNTGKNILQSDIILQRDYNRYLMSENFHQFAHILHKLCSGYNDGHIFLIPFNYDGNLSYNTGFNGGYSFSSSNDYKLKFKSLSSTTGSVILNILWFSPSILDLTNNDLNEILSS